MTSRADIKRIAGSLAVLGTTLEAHGETAWDRTSGWEHGPRKAPTNGERGGGIAEGAEAEDRKDEAAQRRQAARHHAHLRADLAAIDKLQQRLLRRIDIACPPNPSEAKNRATGDYDPWTPAEVAVAGYCTSCHRNDGQMVVREKDKRSDMYFSASLCRWCQGVKQTYGMEPTLEVLKLRHAGRRISTALMDESMTKAIAAAAPKPKGRKKRKKKAA